VAEPNKVRGTKKQRGRRNLSGGDRWRGGERIGLKSEHDDDISLQARSATLDPRVPPPPPFPPRRCSSSSSSSLYRGT